MEQTALASADVKKISKFITHSIDQIVSDVIKELNPFRFYTTIDNNLNLIVFVFLNNDIGDISKEALLNLQLSKNLEQRLKEQDLNLSVRFIFLTKKDLMELDEVCNSLQKIVNSFASNRKKYFIETFFKDELEKILMLLK